MDIIDKLVVTLGLDASGFHKGQKDATKAWSDAKSSIKSDARVMSSAIASVAKEFVGLFIAVRGIDDVIHGFANLNTTLASLSYTARQLGESTGNLRLYQQIAGGFGGTAAGVTQMISGMEQGMFQLRYMGQMSSQMLAWLRFGGGLPPTDSKGGIDVLKMVAQLREHLRGMSNVDKNQILTALGVDDGTRNAILATNKEYQDWLATQGKSAKAFSDGAKNAERLQRAWRGMGYELAATGSKILTAVSPALKALFKEIGDWTERHSKDFTKWLNELTAWANGRGPGQIAAAFDTIATVILDLAKALDALSKVTTPTMLGGKAGAWTRHLISDIFHSQPGTAGNNNPLNLKATGRQASDTRGFAVFPNQRAGIDAAENQLEIYRGRGWNTIGSIVSHWAPASDHNNVPAYISYVSKYVGKGANTPLSTADYPRLMAAMAHMESGKGAPNLAAITAAMVPMTIAHSMRSHHTSNTHIGHVTINANHRDGAGIAVDFKREMQRKFNVFQADPGLF